jgi:hypothetical protein
LTLNELGPAIKRASKSVAYQWPGVVEADDVEQQIYLRLLESPGSVDKILSMDELSRYRSVVGIGHQIASAERTEYDHFKGSYNYSVREVKDLLKQGILTDPPANFRAELVDMLDALDELEARTPQYAGAIKLRYVQHVVPGVSKKDELSRGLTALADEMNKVSRRRYSERDDGLGTRQLVTNAQALEASSSDWDGDDE